MLSGIEIFKFFLFLTNVCSKVIKFISILNRPLRANDFVRA